MVVTGEATGTLLTGTEETSADEADERMITDTLLAGAEEPGALLKLVTGTLLVMTVEPDSHSVHWIDTMVVL